MGGGPLQGGGPTAVVAVEIMTCLLVECKLGGTSVEHPSTILRRSWHDPLPILFLHVKVGSIGILLVNRGTHKGVERPVMK
jgi:hypothetical protein